MAKECTIKFLPDDVTVTAPAGTTVLAAATKAKVYVNSLCGGDGVCGRCRVIVREGKAVGVGGLAGHVAPQKPAKGQMRFRVHHVPPQRVAKALRVGEVDAPLL